MWYNEIMVKELKSVEWEAEEYLEQDRNTWWYVGLFAVGAALGVLAVFIQSWTFLALIILSIVVIIIMTLRAPRKIKYVLSKEGLMEGGQMHKYEDFRAFGILKEGGHFSAVLIPKKRFGIQTKVYFPEKNGEEIVDMLGARLPMEEVKLDFLDKIVNFLRI